MASTNKTANYELSQFLGTDKPAWLTDYNADMSKIDGGIHTAQTTATGADGKADSANTAIGTLANLTTDAKSSVVAAINEVDSHADTAQSTANTASNTANTANTNANKALANVANFNLTSYSTVSVSGANIVSGQDSLYIAKNSDGSLCKIYGQIRSNYQGTTTTTFTSADTGLRPSSAITVQGTVLRKHNTSDGKSVMYFGDFTINTNGTITWSIASDSSTTNNTWFFMASLIFVKDFGDLPAPEE